MKKGREGDEREGGIRGRKKEVGGTNNTTPKKGRCVKTWKDMKSKEEKTGKEKKQISA